MKGAAHPTRGERGIMTGNELRAARQQLGMTQVELAETLGVGGSHISKMESGKVPVSDTIANFVNHLVDFHTYPPPPDGAVVVVLDSDEQLYAAHNALRDVLEGNALSTDHWSWSIARPALEDIADAMGKALAEIED